jgi:hypothetical protein
MYSSRTAARLSSQRFPSACRATVVELSFAPITTVQPCKRERGAASVKTSGERPDEARREKERLAQCIPALAVPHDRAYRQQVFSWRWT